MKKNELLLLLSLLLGCGNSSQSLTTNEKEKQLQSHREQLSTKTEEINILREKILELERSLSVEGSVSLRDPVSVSTFLLQRQPFRHEIELRGSIRSDKNIVLSTETNGRVESISVRVGDYVRANQVLLTLDTDILQSMLSELENELSMAKIRYERQKNLWDKKIGTELQYLEVKSRMQTFQRKRRTLLTQIEKAQIKSPFSGSVEETFAKIGELVVPGQPLIRILNPKDVYVYAEVSDTYTGKIKKGSTARLRVLSTEEEISSRISHVSRVLNNENRTFSVRLDILSPSDNLLPNQVVVLHIEDYINQEALSVPSRLIQKSNRGEFIYRVREENNQKIAEKVYIQTSLTHEGRTEVLRGLRAEDEIISKGALSLTEGAVVSVATKSTID